MPDDYTLFQAARLLGVPPWALAAQPTYWRDRALLFARAEQRAREDSERRQRARPGRR